MPTRLTGFSRLGDLHSCRKRPEKPSGSALENAQSSNTGSRRYTGCQILGRKRHYDTDNLVAAAKLPVRGTATPNMTLLQTITVKSVS